MVGRLHIHRKKNKIELVLHYMQSTQNRPKILNVRPYSEKHLKVKLGQKLLTLVLALIFKKYKQQKQTSENISN